MRDVWTHPRSSLGVYVDSGAAASMLLGVFAACCPLDLDYVSPAAQGRIHGHREPRELAGALGLYLVQQVQGPDVTAAFLPFSSAVAALGVSMHSSLSPLRCGMDSRLWITQWRPGCGSTGCAGRGGGD